MSIKADFHLHSHFSGDCQEPMENMIKKGIELGLTHMCFTEHMDMDFPITEQDPEGKFMVNTDSYLYELITLKEKYANQIKILFGIEVGLQPHIKRDMAKYAKSYDFDFIIGSSHLCNKKDPYYPPFYEGRTELEAYREYFLSIVDNIKSFSNFDVYGHLDYVVRYGPTKDTNYSYAKFADILDSILELLIEKEKGLEINTGGLRKGLKSTNPSIEILRRYRELGGEIITIGSDAHNTDDVASAFTTAQEILLDCGFKYYTTFEKRYPEFHRIV